MAGANANILEPALEPRRDSARAICTILPTILDRWRFFIFLAIAAAYLLGFNGQWLIEPDGGLYLNLARNLASGRGYTYGGIRHETVYPGLPVALAGLYQIFGSQFILAADVLIVLCALASLALVYRLILLAFDRPTAVLVTLGVAISHEFYQYSFEILTDMPFLMGVMAVLAGHEAVFGPHKPSPARWWDWALLFAGLVVATTTRPTMIGLLMAWVAALLYAAVVHRNWKAGAAIALCGAVVGMFLAFDPRRFGGHGFAGGYEQYAIHQLSQMHTLAFTASENIRALLNPLVAKAAFGMPLWGIMNPVFAVIAVAATVALIAKRLLWGLWVILTFATVTLFVSNDRYLLSILPLMVLGWWGLVRAINLRLPGRLGNCIAAFLLTVGTAPNIAQVIGTILHQREQPFLAVYQDGKYEVFARIAPDVARATGPRDVILCPTKSARMMAFLTDRMCFEENEPFPPADRLFVIADPTDVSYTAWLKEQNILPVGEELARAARRGSQPGIYLMRASLGDTR